MTEHHERKFKGVWIPAKIWEDPSLSWWEKCFLAEIDSLGDDDGCWASNAYLAEKFQTTKDNVKNKLSVFKKSGHLDVYTLDREGAPNHGKRHIRVCSMSTGNGPVTVTVGNTGVTTMVTPMLPSEPSHIILDNRGRGSDTPPSEDSGTSSQTLIDPQEDEIVDDSLPAGRESYQSEARKIIARVQREKANAHPPPEGTLTPPSTAPTDLDTLCKEFVALHAQFFQLKLRTTTADRDAMKELLCDHPKELILAVASWAWRYATEEHDDKKWDEFPMSRERSLTMGQFARNFEKILLELTVPWRKKGRDCRTPAVVKFARRNIPLWLQRLKEIRGESPEASIKGQLERQKGVV